MKKQKKEKEKQSWWSRLCYNFDNNPAFSIPTMFFIGFLTILTIISSCLYWIPEIPNCDDIPINCVDFNPHGHNLGNAFLPFLLITEAFFFLALFWIKRKKDESVWHYTWVMKLYSMLFSLIAGVITYVVLLPLSWIIGKFIMLLPKIISFIPKIVILIILHVWKPALFIVALATIVGVWYLINTGLAKLFGGQDG